MNARDIKDYNSFKSFVNVFDKKNIHKYLNLIKFYEKNSTHNIFILSSYIFQRIDSKKVQNKYTYFLIALKNNLKKLDNYDSKKMSNSNPEWFGKEFEIKQASQNSIDELKKIFEEI